MKVVKNLSDNELKENKSNANEKSTDINDLEEKNALIRALANRPFLVIHLFLYFSVMGLLILLWGLAAIQGAIIPFWPVHPIFGWGFGIGIHALTYVMYNDLNKILAKIRRKSAFHVLFLYHAFLYILINIYLIIINLVYMPGLLWFFWPLVLWGIALCLHAFGYLTWDKSFKANLRKLHEKYKDERFKDDYPEEKLQMMARKRITHFWLLLAHIFYFIVINILIYVSNLLMNIVSPTEQINSNIFRGFFLGIHIIGYVIAYYFKMKPVVKGLIFDGVFCALFIILGIYEFVQGVIAINWLFYAIIMWCIIIGIHVIVAKKWDSIRAKYFDKISTISTSDGLDLESYEIDSRTTSLVFWQWSFIAHLLVYAVGLIFIYIELKNAGFNTILLIHPAMGWLIAVAIHAAIYLAVRFQIIEFFPITAMIHLAVYIVTCIYLVLLNILFTPQFPWSLISIAGWGIGLGLHLLLAFLTRRP